VATEQVVDVVAGDWPGVVRGASGDEQVGVGGGWPAFSAVDEVVLDDFEGQVV
jgi:hypothetical protein